MPRYKDALNGKYEGFTTTASEDSLSGLPREALPANGIDSAVEERGPPGGEQTARGPESKPLECLPGIVRYAGIVLLICTRDRCLWHFATTNILQLVTYYVVPNPSSPVYG